MQRETVAREAGTDTAGAKNQGFRAAGGLVAAVPPKCWPRPNLDVIAYGDHCLAMRAVKRGPPSIVRFDSSVLIVFCGPERGSRDLAVFLSSTREQQWHS